MAEEEVKSRRILLVSREENCVKEVIDFLLNSKCASLENIEEKSNGVKATAKYTYGDGSPTVFLSDEDDFELIINLMKKELPRNKYRKLTVIWKWCNRLLEEPLQNLTSTRWSWNDRTAYLWSTNLPVTNNLWFDICGFSGENWPTRVSYNSEHIFELKRSILRFFISLLQVIYLNIVRLSNGAETNNVGFYTLDSAEGFISTKYNILDLLRQCNVSNLSEFISLLKEEVKQLACHLPRLVILCDEVLFLYNGHKIFDEFEKIENFKDLYMKEQKCVNKENITEAVLHSLNIMSGMKYTGYNIKNILGIDNIIALRDHLRFRNVGSDFWYVTGTIVESPLGDGGKEEIQSENKIRETHSDNRIQDIHIDNRIGNIQLLKSLQGSLQEFTEELKNVRHLQENYMKNISENIKEMRKEMHHLKQKLDEVSLKTKE